MTFSILLDISAGIFCVPDYIQPGEGLNSVGWAFLGVFVLNAMFRFFQEYRVEWTMEELRKFWLQRVLVQHGSEDIEISAEHLVSGDVLMVREGDKVPVDARRIEVQNLIANNVP
ncbi:MAG: cation-transporting P-type ATPase [Magnetovibrio sp.]|nr:cation-transporting P-type ATPase [Magnetovibrio sp.]